MSNKLLKITLIGIFCVALIAIPIYALMQRVAINQKQQTQLLQSTSGKPSVPVTDLAPDIPIQNKITVTIKHSDSTFEEVILPKTMLNQYIHNLPKGDIIVSEK